MKKLLIIFLFFIAFSGYSQVVINEVMVQPQPDSTDLQTQSLTYCADTSYGAEWIEIYNGSQCDTIDLSCYMLGSRTADSNFATFSFPSGSRIVPLGFIIVGGGQAAVNVDFAVPDFCGTGNLCGPGQWWLPNDYGWIALYKPDGSVADAVFWTGSAGEAGQLISNAAYQDQPCVPPSCAADSLKAARQMSPGTEILYAGRASGRGLSLYRQRDGSTPWNTDGTPTPGQCNGPCATPSNLAIQISAFGNETCRLSNGWAEASVSGGTGLYDLDWSNNANGDSIGNLVAGNYSVTVTDSSDCKKSTSITLVNIGTPVVVSVDPPQTTIYKGDSVQLALVTPAILDSILWSPTTALSCSDCNSPIAHPTTITTYNVSVVDTNGCIGTASATVEVVSDENSVFIPTAFTPNDDNLNDVLFVRSSKLSSLDFHIYDRWGNEVFSSTDVNAGWDGKDKNGHDVDVGIYVYYAVVNFVNGKSKTLKGNVGVIR